MRRFQPKVFGLALAVTCDPALADDVAQEAFLRAWRSASTYDVVRGSVAVWLLTITRNVAIDAVRAWRSTPTDEEQLDRLLQSTFGGDGHADGTGDEAATRVEVARAVDRLRGLPPEQARAVVLAVFAGCTAEEIGQREACPWAPRRLASGPGCAASAWPATPEATTRAEQVLERATDAARRRRIGMADGRNLERGAGPPDDPHLGDDVVGLVLGGLDADRRAALATHLLRCAACRTEYDELATTAADLLPAVPGVQPPIGFDERVLARLATVRRAGGAGPSLRRWRWVAVAAAVLVALLVPLGVWAVARGDGAGSSGELATLRLTCDGSPVGTVSITDVDGGAMAVVALVAAPPDVSYYCRMHLADGTNVDSEAWPAGNGAWIVPLPSGDVTTVEVLPAGTDKIWSSAELN